MKGASEQTALEGLQAQVRGELLERLQFFRLEPRVIVDLGGGSGAGAAVLRRQFPRAQVIAVDAAYPKALAALRRRRFWRRCDSVCAAAHALPLRAQSVDLVFSSLLLPYCEDPPALFAQVHSVLRPGGLLLFSTLGPDTPAELHTGDLPDMPQLGAAMAASGLCEPVLDRERHGAAGAPRGWEIIYGAAFASIAMAGVVGAGGSTREFAVPFSAVHTRKKPG